MRAAVFAGLLFTIACGGAIRQPIDVAPPPPASLPSPAALPPAPAPPSYGGVWSGSWVVRECLESGGAAGLACQRVPERERLQLRLTQSGTRIEGVLEFGLDRVPVSGTVNRDGALMMTGRRSAETYTVDLLGWQSTASGAAGMGGGFSYSIAPDDRRFGVMTVTATLEDVTRGQTGP